MKIVSYSKIQSNFICLLKGMKIRQLVKESLLLLFGRGNTENATTREKKNAGDKNHYQLFTVDLLVVSER